MGTMYDTREFRRGLKVLINNEPWSIVDYQHVNPGKGAAFTRTKVKNLRTTTIKFFAVNFGIKLATDKEADEFATYAGYEINKSTVYDTSNAVKMEEVKSTPRSGYYAEIMTFKSLLKMKDPRPALAGLDIPVLVLKSQYDNQIWGGTNEYVEIFKNHHLEIIPNAGHSIIRENPGLFLKYIRQFLNK